MSNVFNIDDYRHKFESPPEWLQEASAGVLLADICFYYEAECFIRVKRHDYLSFVVWARHYDILTDKTYLLLFEAEESNGIYYCETFIAEPEPWSLQPYPGIGRDATHMRWIEYARPVFSEGATFTTDAISIEY